jgi:hypothetical protein
MNPDDVRAEIARLGPWHHDVPVAPGIRTVEGNGASRSHAADLGTVRVVQPAYGMRTLVEDVFQAGSRDGPSSTARATLAHESCGAAPASRASFGGAGTRSRW